MSTVFNLIIPTRNRASTLQHSLELATRQDYDNLNIVVSDNFSADNTREVVGSFDDPRIRYLRTDRRLGMSLNWEFALDHVVSGWVMFLGDDDGLVPGALTSLSEVVEAFDVEAVSSVMARFCWPGHFDDRSDGSLAIPPASSNQLKDAKLQLASVLAGDEVYSGLPWLYHGGAATVEAIDRARHSNGCFFRSQVPDVYSAVALSLSVDRYLQVGFPVAINGMSKHSTGYSYLNPDPTQINTPGSEFRQEENPEFHPDLIEGSSLQLLVYECYLQAEHLWPGTAITDLMSQLELASRTAPAAEKAAIAAQCQAIADLNGLAFVPSAGADWRRIADQLFAARHSLRWRHLNPAREGLTTVLNAGERVAELSSTAFRSPLLFQLRALSDITRIARKRLSLDGQMRA